MVTFNHGSHGVLQCLWEISSQCWPGSLSEGVLSASRGFLRRFLLLKLLTVLLCPHVAGLPLLLGCVFSLRALLLLRSPHISTKPSTVVLGHLALSDALVLLHWALWVGLALGEAVQMKERQSVWCRVATVWLCEHLLHSHQLASLLLLGLLGLEATLVSRWPQQTRRFRTSHWAQISCRVVWMLVFLELVWLLQSKLWQNFTHRSEASKVQSHQTLSSLGLVSQSLPAFSVCLRSTLWLVNSWLHYVVLYFKPKRRKSSFH